MRFRKKSRRVRCGVGEFASQTSRVVSTSPTLQAALRSTLSPRSRLWRTRFSGI